MGGKKGLRTYPRHLGPPTGRGIVQDNASGFVRHRNEIVDDVRQGPVGRDKADITPGFGTWHPQDVVQLGILDDPTPVNGIPTDKQNLSRQDLGFTDADILESIRTGKPLRRTC